MTDSFADLDALWGGSIASSVVNLAEQGLTLEIVVLEDGMTSRYDLSFSGLRSLGLSFPDGDLSWDYAELTSIDVAAQPHGLHVEIELWLPECILMVDCAKYEVRLIDRTPSASEIPLAEVE